MFSNNFLDEPFVGKLKMIRVERKKNYLSSLIHSCEAKAIFFIESRFLEGLDLNGLAIFIKSKPFALPRLDHRVLIKFHQHQTIQLDQIFFVRFIHNQLVVYVRQENWILLVEIAL